MAGAVEQLVVSQVAAGRIEGVYEGGDETPVIELRLGDVVLGSARPLADGAGVRRVWLAIPAEAINDGTAALTLHREGESLALATVLLMAGQPEEDDLRGQVAQLRAELDQVKALLRRRLG